MGAFLEAARRIGADIVAASEENSVFAGISPGNSLAIDVLQPTEAAEAAEAFAAQYPIDAVAAVDESSTLAAAAIAERLGLRGNPMAAVIAARDKIRMHTLLKDGGVPSARFKVFNASENPINAAAETLFPCVLKPARLAASQGVIRADTTAEFIDAFLRLRALLDRPEISRKSNGDHSILVEEYLPGQETALEGILEKGKLRTLAIYDKPDPLEGPYFEETLYITPSRHTPEDQSLMAECAQAGTHALGMKEGAIHAELRLTPEGPKLIEIAARSIGGFCSSILRFGGELALEDLILRHALGMDLSLFDRPPTPAGVMMIPIPRSGVLDKVHGIADAIATPGVQDCILSARKGKRIEALPEGGEYLGFIFARGEFPGQVEAALRKAHRCLKIVYLDSV